MLEGSQVLGGFKTLPPLHALIHRSDAPMVKRRRSERRREPRLMSLSARMADARDQHTVDLPGDVALEAANDLSLALALLCAPRDVLLGATISAHPSQTDHVQRTALASRLPPRSRRC